VTQLGPATIGRNFKSSGLRIGICAITFWLENKRNIVSDRFSKEFILETVKIILERYVFYFDGKFYRQKRGTATGTKMAPTETNMVI
jgi:hypothetical protein